MLHTKIALTGPFTIDTPAWTLEYKFWAALLDASNGPLTISAEGEGNQSYVLASLGDEMELPLHGITRVTLSAATYPCWVGYGIVLESSKVKAGSVGTIGVATILPTQVTLTDRSGTLTAANTSQQLAPANPGRRYLLIENLASEVMWINFGAAATQSEPSIQLAANGGTFVMEGSVVSTEAVYVIATTAGHAWTAKEA